MKNTGCLNGRSFGLILCGLMTWFSIMPTQADNVASPAGATLKLQIERKEISKEQAEDYRLNGTKISLGVYMIFSKEWKPYIEDSRQLRFLNSETSWAFYETEAFSNTVNSTDPSHYLQNPSDYISICAYDKISAKPANACIYTEDEDAWYATSFDYQMFGWPTYAWGIAFTGGNINPTREYAEKLDDGSYRIKIYDIQFQLNPSNTNFRSLPVGFLDNILGDDRIDASTSNNQINLALGNDRFWPSANGSTYETCPATSALCQDWTDFAGSKYFEFIPGGLFIQNGPDVETFEPSF